MFNPSLLIWSSVIVKVAQINTRYTVCIKPRRAQSQYQDSADLTPTWIWAHWTISASWNQSIQFNSTQSKPNHTYHIFYIYVTFYITQILYLESYTYTYYLISIKSTKSHAKALFRGISWAGNNETSHKNRKMCNKNQPNTLFLQTLLWTLMTYIVLSGQDYLVTTFGGKRTFGPFFEWSCYIEKYQNQLNSKCAKLSVCKKNA